VGKSRITALNAISHVLPAGLPFTVTARLRAGMVGDVGFDDTWPPLSDLAQRKLERAFRFNQVVSFR